MCGMTAGRDHFGREPLSLVEGPLADVDLMPRRPAGAFARAG
jgi:hypothetical protein